MAVPPSPVPSQVSEELRRVVERWQRLPLDDALPRAPLVRALVEALAAESAGAGPGVSAPVVPDLGPAVLLDQLAVTVYDVCARAGKDERRGEVAAELTERLATLRRAL